MNFGSFTHVMGGDLMIKYTFMLVGFVVAGAYAAPAAADLVSTTPLIVEKTEQEQLALSVQQAVGSDVQKQADLVRYLQQNKNSCESCPNDEATRSWEYAPLFARRSQRWQDQGSVGLSLRSGPTSFGVWGDVREVNAVKNDDQQLLPSSLAAEATVPSALSTQISPGDSGTVGASDVRSGAPKLANPGTVQLRGDVVSVAPLRAGSVSAITPSVATRAPTSTVRNTSDLAYKEYVGGLFMSQSF